jgi:hypothetical protein
LPLRNGAEISAILTSHFENAVRILADLAMLRDGDPDDVAQKGFGHSANLRMTAHQRLRLGLIRPEPE